MKEFASIESFRHLVAKVKKHCEWKSLPLPTISFTGTVKLHGTNAGVRVTDKKVQPQGRQRILSIGSDNYGFAAWCAGREDRFIELTKRVYDRDKLKNLDDVTFFGEWVGKGIQDTVAISKLDRHLVIFGAWIRADTYWTIEDITKTLSNEEIVTFNNAGIYFINQVPTYSITVDFNDLEPVVAKLEELTLNVEEKCPWALFRNETGIGEGIVWRPDGEHNGDSDFWFKTKGAEHKKKTGKVAVEIDAVKVANIAEFVEAVLPPWRLEQGVSQMRQEGKTIEPRNTGDYLKWISQDIIKEETDVLTKNGLCWKDVVGSVSNVARKYWLDECNKEIFK